MLRCAQHDTSFYHKLISNGYLVQQQQASLQAEDNAVRQQVTALAQKYAPVLAQIAAEVAPLKKQWAADLEAIKKKYASPTATTPERTLEMRQVEHWFSPISFLMSEA